METRQAEYKTDLGRMQAEVARRFDGMETDVARRFDGMEADVARRFDSMKADNAQMATENAKRETRLVVTFAGLLAVAVAFLSLQD